MNRIPANAPFVALAVTAQLAVVAGLFRQVLVTRAERRELDDYLQWLLEHAAGPVSVARRHAWR